MFVDDKPRILVDSREKTPWTFSDAVTIETVTLVTGDYTLKGFSDKVVIERKAGEDLWACCGASRERFENELQRMAGLPLRLVIVEAEQSWFVRARQRGKVTAQTVIRSTIAWQQQFDVAFVFCPTPRAAAAFAEYYLTRLIRKMPRRLTQDTSLRGMTISRGSSVRRD